VDSHKPEPARPSQGVNRGRLVRFPGRGEVEPDKEKQGWLTRIGPGLVTGASDLDPSAVVTATVVGAAFAYSLLWLVLLCVPFLLTIFAVTARMGVQTRRGLLELVRERYGLKLAVVAVSLTIISNMAVIVADLMAISDAFAIFLRQPRIYFVAGIAFSVWYILIFHDYRKITQALVWLSLPLYVYVAAAFLTRPNLSQLLSNAFIPHVQTNGNWINGGVAVFGSLLTPYILVWQMSSRTDPGHQPHRGDAYAATLVSCVLFFSVMVASASVLHLSHPVDMTTAQAAEALRPVVGDVGVYVFALGMIGAGMVALPVLVASMCYDVAQAVGWKYGLSEQPWRAKRFYLLISVAMILATMANFTPINPVKALYWSMILAGLLTVPTLAFIWRVSNEVKIVGRRNSRFENFWLGLATLLSTAAAAAYLWQAFAH
jgi:Mn2+/Fe2+ NRAMP family transporter